MHLVNYLTNEKNFRKIKNSFQKPIDKKAIW